MIFSFFKDFCTKIIFVGVIFISPVTNTLGMNPYEKVENQEIIPVSSTDTTRWFNVYCSVIYFFTKPIGQALKTTADLVDEKVVSVLKSKPISTALESGLGLRDFPTCPSKVYSYDHDSSSEKAILRSPKGFGQGLVWFLLGISCVNGVIGYQCNFSSYSNSIISPKLVDPKNFDVCLQQGEGRLLCFRLGRHGLAYDKTILGAHGECPLVVPGIISTDLSNFKKCITAPHIDKIEVCMFTPHKVDEPYLCRSVHLDGFSEHEYKWEGAGDFVKYDSFYFARSSFVKATSKLKKFTMTLGKEIETLAEQDSCMLIVDKLDQNSALKNVISDLARSMNFESDLGQLDFSWHPGLCEMIKNKTEELTAIPDGPVRGLIARSLATMIVQKIHENIKDIPAILVFWTNGILLTNKDSILKQHGWIFGSPHELRIGDNEVAILQRSNLQSIADIIAGLATGDPHNLIQAYAYLSENEAIVISPSMKRPNWTSELLRGNQSDDPLNARPADERHIIEQLIEVAEETCKIRRTLEDGIESTGSMFNIWIKPNRFFSC